LNGLLSKIDNRQSAFWSAALFCRFPTRQRFGIKQPDEVTAKTKAGGDGPYSKSGAAAPHSKT
jgi:hypothetical protein